MTMPARQTRRNAILGDLQQLNTALAANTADLGHLEGSRELFEALVVQAQEIAIEQAALKASKQQASRRLENVLTEGLRLANILRLGVKAHYGIRAEKLAEFGMQPYRGRKVALAPEPGSENPQPPTIE
jgi:hypothetical protein